MSQSNIVPVGCDELFPPAMSHAANNGPISDHRALLRRYSRVNAERWRKFRYVYRAAQLGP
jgi:hypothetical protein